MEQRDEHDIVNAVLAGIRLRQGETDPQMAAFRLPKQVREQLEEATRAFKVNKTDIVVESLKNILPQILRRARQPTAVATGTVPSIDIGVSDMELLEEIRWEQRSW